MGETEEARRDMEPRVIDVSGLPEPVARGLEAVAEIARKLARQPEKKTGPVPELPVWALGAIGGLSREDIYSEYDYRS
jgi:hypothetical protein